MKKIQLLLISALVLLAGCVNNAVSKSGLYWGNYSHTLYAYKKNPNPKTQAEHVAELNRIVEKSKELKLRVPPGIYAELGMFALEDGHRHQARTDFGLELATYPESKAMVSQLLRGKNVKRKVGD